MKNIKKLFITLSIIFAIVTIVFTTLIIWDQVKKSAFRSCVYSVTGDVVEYSKLVGNFAKSSKSWYVLNDEEAKKVLAEVSFRDCSFSSSQPKDLKEKKLKIAVKKNGEFGYEVKVWSRGFDNISGTDDDIYYPFDEKLSQ